MIPTGNYFSLFTFYCSNIEKSCKTGYAARVDISCNAMVEEGLDSG